MWVKKKPNTHEIYLFERSQKYIQAIRWIPWIEMIAVVNSLSMFATHKDSDIDLFFVTTPKMMWFVRFFVTFIFWILWVWRHRDDIAQNFCLSFFITTDAMDFKKIAIKNDIYLYYWIFYMKPIFIRWDFYEQFLWLNNWVNIDTFQKQENQRYITIKKPHKKPHAIWFYLDTFLRYIFLPKTQKQHEKLWRRLGIVISDTMLKFHNIDRRESIRDKIFEKNFDK